MQTSLTGWPAHLCTTFNKLHAAKACQEGYAKVAKFIRDQLAVTPKDFGMDRPIPIALILESNGFEDAMWTFGNAVKKDTDRDRFLRLLSCDFAEHVLHIFEKKYPDDKRVRECIEAVRKFSKGEATEEERIKAQRDAAAASASASDAAYAASASAAYAAYASAYSAAYAASAAASAADYAASASAARITERQWQSGRLMAALHAESAHFASTFSKGSEMGNEAVQA